MESVNKVIKSALQLSQEVVNKIHPSKRIPIDVKTERLPPTMESNQINDLDIMYTKAFNDMTQNSRRYFSLGDGKYLVIYKGNDMLEMVKTSDKDVAMSDPSSPILFNDKVFVYQTVHMSYDSQRSVRLIRLWKEKEIMEARQDNSLRIKKGGILIEIENLSKLDPAKQLQNIQSAKGAIEIPISLPNL